MCRLITERNFLENENDSLDDSSYSKIFRVHWITIYEGQNIWEVSQKKMVINEFTNALHEDERLLAGKYKDEKGTDWKEYVTQKEKAGFGKFDDWFFMDFNHVTTQLKSKYKNKWGHRTVGVTVNDRKVDVQLYVAGNRKIVKKGQDEAHDIFLRTAAAEKKMVHEVLEPFLAAGHGVNFRVEIDEQTRRRSELIAAFEGKAKYILKALTVIWINHEFMSMVLHEDDTFLECDEE